MLRVRFAAGLLVECRSLAHPEKGDLALLKNWRLVALLCTDYKLLSKVLANRLKKVLDQVIHRDQSYCVPDRSIMDNLFLMRDLVDVCKLYSFDTGVFSLDQEKAFDRVDHGFLFGTLRAFGFGGGFLSLLGLLYKDACCLVKVGGALSCPVRVGMGIRQGCPISGQLYSLVIEPLLCRLRSRLTGLRLPGLPQRPPLVLSAYADDISVIIRNQGEVDNLTESLTLYQKASSAKVNRDKSEALLIGQWTDRQTPKLPGDLGWGRQGLRVLGVSLGTEEYERRNWEGVLEKVCARLTKWKWLLPQLSYRGRVLIANNLVTSALWHRLTVLTTPRGLINAIPERDRELFLVWAALDTGLCPVSAGAGGWTGTGGHKLAGHSFQTADCPEAAVQPWSSMDRHSLSPAKEGWKTWLRQAAVPGPASVCGYRNWTYIFLSVGATGLADSNSKTEDWDHTRDVDL